MWQYVDNTIERKPKNRMYLSWKTTTTHYPFIFPPKWAAENYQKYLEKGDHPELWYQREHLPVDTWLNAVRWTDDIVRDIILGFRERGIEDETLFVMYVSQKSS
jgi:phosphoglycerol transferase MdoB-like AlkP superfamily enzyme